MLFLFIFYYIKSSLVFVFLGCRSTNKRGLWLDAACSCHSPALHSETFVLFVQHLLSLYFVILVICVGFHMFYCHDFFTTFGVLRSFFVAFIQFAMFYFVTLTLCVFFLFYILPLCVSPPQYLSACPDVFHQHCCLRSPVITFLPVAVCSLPFVSASSSFLLQKHSALSLCVFPVFIRLFFSFLTQTFAEYLWILLPNPACK